MTAVERWLAFTPRDTVTVRDGRSFQAGTDSSAETVRPWPSTIAGAVRTAYGKEPEAVRGPVLARRTGTGGWEPYLPMPADVVRPPGSPRACLLRPDPELAGIATDLGEGLLAPPATTGKVEEVQGWVPGARFADYLHGTIRPAGFDLDETLRPYGAGRDPLVPERRVGLARTGGRTAREGFLYQSTHLRPLDGWSFLACNDVPEDDDWTPQGPTPFGGRGRLADVAEVSGVDWPAAPTTFPDGRVLVYLATPALWPEGWRPETPAGADLVGAAVPTPRPVATASPREARRRGARLMSTVALRWAVPAGAVYLLRFDDPARAAAWAREQHARPWGPPAAARLDTAGFGIALIGTWKGPGS